MRRLLAGILLLMTGVVAMAQDTTAPVISPELQTHLESLEQTTTDLRELETLSEVDLLFPTPDDLKVFLEDELATGLTDDVLREAMAFYTAFDFLEPDTQLLDIVMALYQDQIAGFYNPDDKGMNVILMSGKPLEDRLPLLERVIFVHEYTHALQDQHFDLKTYLGEEYISDDRSLARQALVEGDATYVMTLYTIQTTQEDPAAALQELIQGGLDAGSLSVPPGTPEILSAELLFPYEAGQGLVEALFEEGGWKSVDAAYSQPPASTEQVIHPEKYIAGEMPVEVTLPDGDDFPAEGWTLMTAGTLGEFYLRQYLATLLPFADSSDAAAGWGGDRYEVYQNEAGDQAWQLKIVWDTPADAVEFRDTFATFSAERTLSTAAADGACYVAPDITLCAEYDDTSVLITSKPSA